jgi:membrane-bound lytic murein transglycosylase D
MSFKNYFFFLLFLFAQQLQAQKKDSVIAVIADTTVQTAKVEEEIIDEIVVKNKVPSKDKVQYFSQLTRYGFKNLFPKYGYNPAMPYSSQVNPNAEAYMQDYLRVHSKGLIRMKSWGITYFNLIDNILTQYGVPKELKYLAVIESNLSPAATSWVGAGGPWQFMPYTARDYGLIVNGAYDERRDYYKSTSAAARYLLTLYKSLKDWLLVIAAYNGGPGRVYSAIKRSGSRNFWALQYYLPEESRNHVKKFIATHYIMEGGGSAVTNSADNRSFAMNAMTGGTSVNPYNNKPVLTTKEMEAAETQMISGKFNSIIIVKNLVMDIATFNRYNPGFDSQIATNGKYELILPEDKMQLFTSIKYQILNECVQLLLADDNVPTASRMFYPDKYKKKKKSKY